MLALLEQSLPLLILSCVVLGLLVGSFLNVVIHRLPIMMQRDWQREFIAYFAPKDIPPAPGGVALDATYNLAKPDSTCPKCQHKITALQNMPIISYLLLKGQCAQCNTPISVRYPMIEGITGALCGFLAWHYGFSIELAIMLLVTMVLISAIAIDIDHMLLPDQLTLPLLWAGLLIATQNVFVTLHEAVIGAALGYLFLWSIYWVFKLTTGKEGMGFGDFKLLAALGAFVGYQHLLVIILLSSVVALVLALSMKLFTTLRSYASHSSPSSSNKTDDSVPQGAFPFGPYLGIAGWITILYGDTIVAQYFLVMGIH